VAFTRALHDHYDPGVEMTLGMIDVGCPVHLTLSPRIEIRTKLSEAIGPVADIVQCGLSSRNALKRRHLDDSANTIQS